MVYDRSQNEKEIVRGHGRMKTRERENEKERGETERWNSLLGVSEHGKCVGLTGPSPICWVYYLD